AHAFFFDELLVPYRDGKAVLLADLLDLPRERGRRFLVRRRIHEVARRRDGLGDDAPALDAASAALFLTIDVQHESLRAGVGIRVRFVAQESIRGEHESL